MGENVVLCQRTLSPYPNVQVAGSWWWWWWLLPRRKEEESQWFAIVSFKWIEEYRTKFLAKMLARRTKSCWTRNPFPFFETTRFAIHQTTRVVVVVEEEWWWLSATKKPRLACPLTKKSRSNAKIPDAISTGFFMPHMHVELRATTELVPQKTQSHLFVPLCYNRDHLSRRGYWNQSVTIHPLQIIPRHTLKK